MLELVLLCVQGFEAFLLLLFSSLFYLFVFSDRSWVDFLWFPLPPSPSSLLICWCFLCWWVSFSRRYPGVPGFYPLFFVVGLLRAMGVSTEPSLICTLPSSCGLSSLRDEVQTLPGGCVQSLVGGTLPGHCTHSPCWCLWSLLPLR